MRYHRSLPKPIMAWHMLKQSFMGDGWRSYVRFGDGAYKYVNPGKHDWHLPFVADPFLFVHNGKLWLFAETTDPAGKGLICGFVYEKGRWKPLGKILEESFHLSYPQVFEHNGHIYMIPESSAEGKGCVALYETIDFPYGWKKVMTLIDRPFADATLLHLEGHWYMSCYTIPPHETAELWHAPDLLGLWERHPQWNKVNQSNRLRRCGGRFLVSGDRIWRVAQDCNGLYGKRLFKVPLLKISPTDYLEGEAQLLLDKTTNPRCYKHTYNELMFEGEKVSCLDVQWAYARPIREALRCLIDRLVKKFGS